MSEDNDAKQLKRCFENIIESVNEIITKIEPSDKSISDSSSENIVLNNDLNTFTLNEQENELMDELKTKIENLLDECLGRLSRICKRYLFNFLYQYEYDTETNQFKNAFTRSILPSFQRDLQGILASVDAFPAAWNGNLPIVKNFIINYPNLKDKPGLWGTTLLYSAAKNNNMNIAKYLIEIGQCSVNAQNEQDLEQCLLPSTTTTAGPIQVNPTAASTALHGACFTRHLDVVKYLIDKGADYFIQNQACETPIMNGEHHQHIKDFFKNYLILGYSTNSDILPINSIMEKTKERETDSKWEYKPFDTNEWHPFSPAESFDLQQSSTNEKNFRFITNCIN
jgi:hypothetical protein